MANDTICYMSATQAIAAFEARTLSPVELMRAVINRSEAVNPKVNAFTYTFYERALDQARKAEAKYAKTDGRLRRLEGVPIVIKDDHQVKGEITTHGSRLYAAKVDEQSSLTVDRLLRAGAIMHARTTTPEFAAATICHSPLWGVTRNPWNTEYSTGGSSGGAGAAVAAGMTTLADGADYAGSVRIPASCTGIFGFKPPTGRNPANPPWNLNAFSVHGPLTRTVADAALMQNVMSGRHPADITSLDRKLTLPTHFDGIAGWKVALSVDLGFFEVSPEVERNLKAAGDVLQDLGCQVDEVELGWTEEVIDAFYAHTRTFSFEPVEDMEPEDRAKLADYNRDRSARQWAARSTTFAQSVKVRTSMYEKLGPILDSHRVLVCPTTAVPAVAAEHAPINDGFTINGKVVDATIGWCMTFPFNMLSQLPAASVPNGFSSERVPIGMQIVGSPFDDVGVFRAAAAFERARPSADKHPAV